MSAMHDVRAPDQPAGSTTGRCPAERREMKAASLQVVPGPDEIV